MIKFSTFLISLLLVFYSTFVFGQVSFDSRLELEEAANEFFVSEQFDKAKPLYSQLLSLSALEPNYNYRFGVCVLFTEADPLKSLPYIEGGANTAGVNVEAFYYLGLAEQLTYSFDPAITNYQKARDAGYTNSKVDINKAIQECRNGKLLYNSAVDFAPAQDKEVFEAEFYRPYDFRKLKGKVIPLPPTFKTKYDTKNLKGTVVFTPSRSQTLVYASYGEDGKNKKDLYRVNRLPNGEWAIPQRLPDVINTPYDEDYAFFDEESSTLYFASKGHNTMGGYDIFRSEYTDQSNSWSPPVNLQHPINSPFDDFLYVSDPSGKVAFFTSKRGTEFGKLRVFKTLLYDPEQVVLSVVQGTYEDKTDSTFNYMTATVFDTKTNQVVGKFKSHPQTGKYLLILPPQNDYSVDVAPKEAGGFKFDLDVPKHDESKPLQQDLVFDTKGDEAVVTLTNFFDAAGKPDTIALSKARDKNEVESEMVEVSISTESLAQNNSKLEKAEQNKEAEKASLLKDLAAKEATKLQTELAKQDSLVKAKEAAFLAEAQRLKNEQTRKDSLARAEELAALKKQEKLDSIAEVEEQLLLAANREKQTQDSIAKVQKAAKDLAIAQEKSRLDSIAKANELAENRKAEREKAIADSLANAEQLAVERALKKEEARLDSLATIEKQLALTAEREQRMRDSIAKVNELVANRKAELEKAIADSLANAEQVAVELALKKEQIRADSLANVEQQLALATEQKQQIEDSIAEVKELAKTQFAEREKAIADSIAKAEEVAANKVLEQEQFIADSLTKLEENLALKLEEEKLVADSLAETERIALEKAERARQDSLFAAQERASQDSLDLLALAAAEEKRLKEIEAEVERLKLKAMKDSLGQPEVAKSDEEDFDALLAEMQQKEAEILEQQEEGLDSETVTETTKEVGEEIARLDPGTTKAEENVSEADLFLQRIADLEKQKQQQEAEVKAENDRLAAEREKEQQELIIPDSSLVANSDTIGPNIALANDTTKQNPSVKTPASEVDLELASIALKSDADPNEYLDALAEIEEQIAADNKLNSKSYELVDLPSPVSKSEDSELESILEKDRKAIEAHKEIASKKEAELQLQMDRDREKLESVLADDQAEIEEVEAELLEQLAQNQKTRGQVETVLQEKQDAKIEEEVDQTTEELTQSSESEEEALVSELSSEEAILSEAEEVVQQIAQELKEPDTTVMSPTVETAVGATIEPSSNETDEIAEVVKEEEPEVSLETAEELKETPEIAVEEAQEEITTEEKQLIVESEEAIEEAQVDVVNQQEPTIDALEETSVVPETEKSNAAKEIDVAVTNIHFMEAALRNYNTQKPNFSAIENNSMRRMIQRMRAEDIGRLAVLKNMKNTWIESGKSQTALKEIKSNRRNQEVLANVAENEPELEKQRNPYNPNDAKPREGVYFKLDFAVSSSNVSETVAEAMTPEQAMTFAMPEFNISVDYFKTLSDARAEMRYYKSRGFDQIRVVAFKDNEQIMLSDVENIPFVD